MSADTFINKAKARFGERLQVSEIPGTSARSFELTLPEARDEGEVRDAVDDLFALARMVYEEDHTKAA